MDRLKFGSAITGSDEALAETLRDIAVLYKEPAIAVGIVDRTSILSKAVVGLTAADGDRQVKEDSRFHIGSTTKSMTAVLAAMLVTEGKFSYDTPVAELLPDIRVDPAYREVTVEDLMLNRAGLVPFQQTSNEDPALVRELWEDMPAKYPDPVGQRKKMTGIVFSLKPYRKPRGKALYSNVGWSVLGHVLETCAGMSFEDLLRTRIFAPLGMTGARIGGWPADSGEIWQPRGHYRYPDGRIEAQAIHDTYTFPDWMNPAGGVHCGIADFSRYAIEHLSGISGTGILLEKEAYGRIHGVRIRPRAKDLYQNMKSWTKLRMGYGWGLLPSGNGFISVADGSGGTFYARIVVSPVAGVGFVGFTNSGAGEQALSAILKKTTGIGW